MGRRRRATTAVVAALFAAAVGLVAVESHVPGVAASLNAADELDYRRELTSARGRYAQYLLQRSAQWRRALYAADAGPTPGGYDAWAEQFPPEPCGDPDLCQGLERRQFAARVARLTDPRISLRSGLPPEDYLMQMQSWRYPASAQPELQQLAADAYLARLQVPWAPETLATVTLPDPRLQRAVAGGAPNLSPPLLYGGLGPGESAAGPGEPDALQRALWAQARAVQLQEATARGFAADTHLPPPGAGKADAEAAAAAAAVARARTLAGLAGAGSDAARVAATAAGATAALNQYDGLTSAFGFDSRRWREAAAKHEAALSKAAADLMKDSEARNNGGGGGGVAPVLMTRLPTGEATQRLPPPPFGFFPRGGRPVDGFAPLIVPQMPGRGGIGRTVGVPDATLLRLTSEYGSHGIGVPIGMPPPFNAFVGRGGFGRGRGGGGGGVSSQEADAREPVLVSARVAEGQFDGARRRDAARAAERLADELASRVVLPAQGELTVEAEAAADAAASAAEASHVQPLAAVSEPAVDAKAAAGSGKGGSKGPKGGAKAPEGGATSKAAAPRFAATGRALRGLASEGDD